MAVHTFQSPVVEEFYNSCHTKDSGRFCALSRRGKGPKGAKIVPMSEGARRSNAILRGLASARKSKEYKIAQKNAAGTWANRETGQGGLRGVKGVHSKKADAARAANAVKGAITRTVGNPNKDGSVALKGAFKVSGNKRADTIKITQLDRGSKERLAAVRAYDKAYSSNSSRPSKKA